MKVLEKIGSKLSKLGKKGKLVASSLVVGAMTPLMTIVASAEDGIGGGVAYSSLSDALKSGFSDMVSNVMLVCVAIVPIGIGIFGLYFAVGMAKKFFKKVTG